MESDPLKFWLGCFKKCVFYAIAVELEGARCHGPKKSDNLPPTTVSSFTDEDAFELEDAFNEEVMLHKSSHREREYKKHSKTESHHLGIHRHCFGLRLLRWIDLQNKDKHCLFMSFLKLVSYILFHDVKICEFKNRIS